MTTDQAVGVLLTVVGRKSYVLKALRSADRKAALWVGDADALAPIRIHAPDTFIRLPPVTDGERYSSAVEQAALSRSIGAVLPVNDMDVGILAGARDRLDRRGIRLLVPPPDETDLCCDKLRFARWLTAVSLPHIPTWTLKEAPLSPGPYVVKERRGQGSRGFAVVESLEGIAGDLVVQPFVAGEHYDADVIRSWSGRSCAVVLKRKLEMQGGTASLTESVRCPELEGLASDLAQRLDARGAIDVDFIMTEQGPRILEVNPRLGGLFSHACFAAPGLADALLAVAAGEEVPSLLVESGVKVFTEWNPVRLPG